MLFALAILLLLWFFQLLLLKPFYMQVKMGDVRFVAHALETGLIKDELDASITESIIENNVCAMVYSSGGTRIFGIDALGINCYLNNPEFINNKKIVEVMDLINATEGEFYTTEFEGSENLLFYGRKTVTDFTDYYILINSANEPSASAFSIMIDQFKYVSITVFVLSSGVALVIAGVLAKPLHSLVKSARKLAAGDVGVTFEAKGYHEVQELAHTLNYATQALATMDELRKDMVANVSHDIKTPVTTIRAYAEMLKDISGSDPLKRQEHLDIIVNEAKHLDVLVSDMLRLSLYEQPHLEVTPSLVHLRSLVNQTIQLFQNVEHQQITFVAEVDEAIVVYVDEVKLGQIVYNFINNAIVHNPPNEKIIIKATPRKNSIRLEVIDFGKGIAKSDLTYIWDRYYQIDKQYHRSESGSGLGLSIVKSICIASNIPFGVHSEIGKGSTFYVDLPIEPHSRNT